MTRHPRPHPLRRLRLASPRSRLAPHARGRPRPRARAPPPRRAREHRGRHQDDRARRRLAPARHDDGSSDSIVTRAAHAADGARPPGRGGARALRRADPGADAQPARRAGHPRRQSRRCSRSRRRDRVPRRLVVQRLRLVRASSAPGLRRSLVFALGSTARLRNARAAGARRRRRQSPCCWHSSTALVSRSGAFDQYRFWDVGSLADRGSRDALADRAVHRRRRRARARARPPAQRARARRRRAAARSAPCRAHPRARRPSRSRCCAARPPPRPARSSSSGSPCPHIARSITGPGPALGVRLLAPARADPAARRRRVGRVVVRPVRTRRSASSRRFLGAPVFIALRAAAGSRSCERAVVRAASARASVRCAAPRRPLVVAGSARARRARDRASLGMASGDFPSRSPRSCATRSAAGDAGTDFVVLDLRLPARADRRWWWARRSASAARSSRALTRNPLGSPDFVGFTTGASTGALVAILIVGGGVGAVALGALIGGMPPRAVYAARLHAAACRASAWSWSASASAAMLQALNAYMIIRARLDEAADAQLWLIGSLNGRGWSTSCRSLSALAVLLPLVAPARPAAAAARARATRSAGAHGVGVERTRAGLIGARRRPGRAGDGAAPGRSASSRSPRRSWPAGSPAPPVPGCCQPRDGRAARGAATSLAQRPSPPGPLPVGVVTGASAAPTCLAAVPRVEAPDERADDPTDRTPTARCACDARLRRAPSSTGPRPSTSPTARSR